LTDNPLKTISQEIKRLNLQEYDFDKN
jgi:hypothetical protein